MNVYDICSLKKYLHKMGMSLMMHIAFSTVVEVFLSSSLVWAYHPGLRPAGFMSHFSGRESRFL